MFALQTPLTFIIILIACVLLFLEFVLLYIVLRLMGQVKKLLAETGAKPRADQTPPAGDTTQTAPTPNSQNVETTTQPAENIEETTSTPTPQDEDTAPTTPADSVASSFKTRKERVLEAIRKRKEVGEADLPSVRTELTGYFNQQKHEDYSKDLFSQAYFRFLDLRNDPSKRVVIVGDVHCDFHSLVAVLLKLSVSDYDYFENAYFVFLGDYLDRGDALFEPLLLLKDLQDILGDRLILLKGNHETIAFDQTQQKMTSHVRPNESSACLNQYCQDDPHFLKQFAAFYSTLPTYVYVKSGKRNILLTHAAIPREQFLNICHFDENEGSLIFEAHVPYSEQLNKRNMILKDMIWGDPKECDEKMQVDGRFEYGRLQFDRFALKNHIDMLLRSHEEAPYGHKSFFRDQLFTIFSTGGEKNPQTGYPLVEPAFGILHEGQLSIENSYIYQVETAKGLTIINLFSKIELTAKQAANLKLQREFLCDATTKTTIREIFKSTQANFSTE